MSEQPKPGEWWVKNDNSSVIFIVGYDPDENVVYVSENRVFDSCDEEWLTQGLGYKHVPECTGFDWKRQQPCEPDLLAALVNLRDNMDRIDQRLQRLEALPKRMLGSI